MSDITLADFTDATTGDDGTGAFDIMMQAFERHIVEQYDAGRITGSDYATVYLGGTQEVMKQSIAYILNQEKAGFEADEASAKIDVAIGQTAKLYADIALIDQKQVTELAQTTDPTGGILGAKQDLIAAQTLGFASDTKQKVLKQMLEGYAVTLSIAGSATAPDATKEPQIDALVDEILTDVGSAVNIP